ncbi:hypothetical protein D4R71_00475 [bacterium]|nr:MAG: hypothetical protein D4R71_00475 [bacterium]
MSLEIIGKATAKDLAEYQHSKFMAKLYKRCAKQEKWNIKLIPWDKKLLKSSKVRKYLKLIAKVVSKQLEDEHAYAKIFEAYILGVPLVTHPDGKIEVVKDYYKKGKK